MPSATLIGFTAILMWSLLSLLTVASGTVPPFQLAAMTFAIGGGLGAATWLFRPGAPRALKQPWPVWALGVGGLFGYHALYFLALRLAPPAEAQLVSYLWPVLIVLLSALLPGERLRLHHVAGALIALCGTVLLFAGRGVTLTGAYLPGFAAAFVAAFTWAIYSVLSRRFADVPSDAVVGFCLATAVLAAISHIVFEQTHWPENLGQWLAVAALGIGPVGAAFYVWDIGMKRGDIRVLGVASYLAPLLSTLFLVLAGYAACELRPRSRDAADRRRWRARREGYASAQGLARRPVLRRHLERCKVKSRRDRAAHQCPRAEAFGSLPVVGRHDALRPLAHRDVGAELHAADRAAGSSHLQHQRRTRVVVPDLGRIDAMPVRSLALRQQESRSRWKRRGRSHRCAGRETSRGNARLPDAASNRAGGSRRRRQAGAWRSFQEELKARTDCPCRAPRVKFSPRTGEGVKRERHAMRSFFGLVFGLPR